MCTEVLVLTKGNIGHQGPVFLRNIRGLGWSSLKNRDCRDPYRSLKLAVPAKMAAAPSILVMGGGGRKCKLSLY